MQTGKDSFIRIRKIMENLEISFACFCHSFIQSQVVITLVTLLFQNEQASSCTAPFNMLVGLFSSAL